MKDSFLGGNILWQLCTWLRRLSRLGPPDPPERIHSDIFEVLVKDAAVAHVGDVVSANEAILSLQVGNLGCQRVSPVAPGGLDVGSGWFETQEDTFYVVCDNALAVRAVPVVRAADGLGVKALYTLLRVRKVFAHPLGRAQVLQHSPVAAGVGFR